LRSQFNKSKIGATVGMPRDHAVPSRSCFLISVKHFKGIMSEPQTPHNELARLRALVSEYETKMTGAASQVARVRHEINNPLAALLGQAQLLLREELSDKARGRVQSIEELAKRIEKIVSELRDIQTPAAAVNRQEE
jgi:signal transduction histidine kinase